jgi:hypothetical protein
VIFAGDADIKDYDSFYLNDSLKRLKPLLGKKLKKGRGRPFR